MKRLLYIFIVLGFVAMPAVVSAADMYIILDKAQVASQGTFSATVYVSTGGLPINNAEGTIHFPADILNVDSVSTNGSIFNIWVEQPGFSNTAGTIYFNGGLPTPGYSGEAGQSLRINFRAKKAGAAELSFGSAAIRANDGNGTNVIARARGVSISVTGNVPVIVPIQTPEPTTTKIGVPRAPIFTSSEMPDQNAWYNKTSVSFLWDLPLDATAVQLVLSLSPNALPTISYEPPITSKNLTDLAEGTLYLNGRFKNSFGWGKIASRKIQIDTTEPENFLVKTDVTKNDLISIEASAKDSLSGMRSYVVYSSDEKIAESLAEVSGPTLFSLPPLNVGNHKFAVRAYDKAGNYAETNISVDAPEIKAPKITHYPEYIKVGSKIEIRGKSPYTGTEVKIWIKEEGKESKGYLVKPDEDKIFSLTSDTIETLGTVSVWAETMRAEGVKSAPSEKVYVSVKESDAVWLGTMAVQIISIAITFLVLLFGLLVLIYLGIRRMNAMKRRLRKDLIHTEQEVHKVFGILKGDTKRHLKMLEKASMKRKLTKEESTIFTELAEGLEETEKYLSQKIKNIEKEDL